MNSLWAVRHIVRHVVVGLASADDEVVHLRGDVALEVGVVRVLDRLKSEGYGNN